MAVSAGAADDGAPRWIKVPEMNTLLGWLPGLLALLQAPAAAAAGPGLPARRMQVDVEADPPGACGWFDSSHELVQGLQVQELSTPESLAAALPLALWLQLHQAGCGSTQRA